MLSVTKRNQSSDPQKASAYFEMVNSFILWADSEGLKTYDWWDIWSNSYGLWSKSLYVKNKNFGTIAVLPFILLDIFLPSFRRLFAKKRTYPISHAQVGLAYLNLYKATGKNEYLERTINLIDPLFKMASPLTKGLGWGMKHEWMTVQGLVPADTPCNTQTSYVYELMLELYLITNDSFYLDSLKKIANHVVNDFPEWWEDDKLVCSYSTVDARRVINANSYRMFILIDAGIRFNDEHCMAKGLATLKYILSKQSVDGSWVYSEDQHFIDGFHTCFVLKNLYKVNCLLKNPSLKIDEVIHKGLEYFSQHLIDKTDYPIPFSVKPRMVLYKYDIYDFAECIGLYADMGIRKNQVYKMLDFVKAHFQSKKGWFSFRIFPYWKSKGIPYMRSANSAMFLAISKALLNQPYSEEKSLKSAQPTASTK